MGIGRGDRKTKTNSCLFSHSEFVFVFRSPRPHRVWPDGWTHYMLFWVDSPTVPQSRKACTQAFLALLVLPLKGPLVMCSYKKTPRLYKMSTSWHPSTLRRIFLRFSSPHLLELRVHASILDWPFYSLKIKPPHLNSPQLFLREHSHTLRHTQTQKFYHKIFYHFL